MTFPADEVIAEGSRHRRSFPAISLPAHTTASPSCTHKKFGQGEREGFCTRSPIRASRWPISFEQAGKLGLRGPVDGPETMGPRYGPGPVRSFEGAWRHCESCPD
jgi:hypothetical protein